MFLFKYICLFLSVSQIDGFIVQKLPPIKSKKILMSTNPSKIIYELGISKNKLGSEWTYNDLVSNIKAKNIEGISIIQKNKEIQGFVSIDHNYLDTPSFENLHPINSPLSELSTKIIELVTKSNLNFDVLNLPNDVNLVQYFIFPLQLIFGYTILVFLINALRNSMGGPQGPMGPMGGSPLNFLGNDENLISASDIETTFNDVAGCDEAKYELEEVVEFLKNPLKFEAAGAKIPKGVLLDGPPGTGKTLLAKAVAGEAKVGFISATGSEFIEMFVGVGASRVRKLFEKAEKNKPCVIFIDEIDAVGRQRGAGVNSGNDEREQTLNQILTNMDGFKGSDGIIVLGATNRADILDNALTRSGRFDRKITVSLPDKQGRKEILDVHLKNKKYNDNLDFDEIATLTGGFSGADLANMANEAAIFSVRYNQTEIDRKCMIDAYEKMVIGLPKKNYTIEFKADQLVAFHESGHTITACLFDNFFNVRKVTVNANKGGAGGYTLFTPVDYYNNYPTKEYMLANIIVSLGGRAAERILYSDVSDDSKNYDSSILFSKIPDLKITTGASNDLKQAENLARNYINNFGINDKLGIRGMNGNDQPFLGRDLASPNKLSEFSKEKIDKEIQRIIEYCYERAVDILLYNKQNLIDISNLLLEKRVIDRNDLDNYEIIFKQL